MVNDEAFIQKWERARKRWGDEVAQVAAEYTIRKDPQDPVPYFWRMCQLKAQTNDATRRGNKRNPAIDSVMLEADLVQIITGAEEGSPFRLRGRTQQPLYRDEITPERRAVARQSLRRVPQWLVHAVWNGDYDPEESQERCRRGHLYRVYANFRRRKNGLIGKECRACRADRQREHRAKQKEVA